MAVVTHEDMQQEAVKRMREHGMTDTVTGQFEREGILMLVEDMPNGLLKVTPNDRRLVELAKQIEEENGFMIYAAHLAHAFAFGRTIGDLWTLFGVSADPQEWPHSEELARNGFERAFVISPEEAEFQDVETKTQDERLLIRKA